MGNIRFGHKNLCLGSGVTFTPTGEAAAHDADNLAKIHPAAFWRIPTLAGGSDRVTVTFPNVETWDLVSPLYVTASPHQSLVKNGFLLNDTDWTETNAQISVANTIMTGEIPDGSFNAVAGGPSLHMADQTYTRVTGGDADIATSVYVDTSGTSGGANLQLRISNGSGSNFRCNIDCSDGSIQSSAVSGTAALTSATTEVITGTVHRISLIGRIPSSTAVTTGLLLLDSSFASSYTAIGNEIVNLGGVTTELGTSVGTAIDGRTGKGSFWAPGDNPVATWSQWLPIPSQRDSADWFSSMGFLHAFKLYSTTQSGDSLTVWFLDPHNENSQLDISNIYIGPTWSPTKNLAENYEWGVDPITGARTLMVTLAWATEAEAYGDAIPMALKAGVGIKSAAIADGGQEYRRDRQPVLVILDPDEATYAQEQMIYGFIDEFKVKPNKYIANVDGSGNSGLAFAVEIKIKEVLP